MMKIQRLALGLAIISIFLIITAASAQVGLVANVPREDQHLWGNDSNAYSVELESGHWTVVVDSESFWDLEIKIIVSLDGVYGNAIAESGNESGNFPRVSFTLDTNDTVYIRVIENSVYHDSSGYYTIGIYDDAHVPGFLASLDFFDYIIIIIILSFVIPICIGVFAARRARRGMQHAQETIRLQAPIHAIPDKYQGSVQHHGSQTTTVRLPLKCPSCGAEVSHESVDWVGPLEAKCSYCGATMRATFERV